MRDKVFVKEQLKQVKKHKKDVDTKAKNEEGILYDKSGEIKCAIPFLECTRIGHALPETMADGVKMCCTNPDCIYVKQLVHMECFRSLEQNLMTLMSVKGYDKSVTENVRINRERLWIKKGLQLVQKNLRCECGKGQMTRDNEAWEEREKQFGPPVEEKEKKHKTKKTKLPSVVTTVKANNRAPPPHDAKNLRKLENHYLSSHSPPPDELDQDYKYGFSSTTKAMTGAVPYPSFGIAKQTTNFNKFSTAVNNRKAAANPKAPKFPIGFAPIEPKPRPLAEEEESDEEDTVETTEEIFEDDFSSHGENDEWKETMPPTSQPLPNISKANEELFPHFHFSYNPNPNLKNALVQTDETCFAAALITEPWLKMYASKDSFDSGLDPGSPHSYFKDSDSNSLGHSGGGGAAALGAYGYYNSGRSSVINNPPEIPYVVDDDILSSIVVPEREFTRISFILLNDGKFGIEIYQNGRKEMLKNNFENVWTPLYLSMADKNIEIGEKAQYHQCDFPKHVAYDILKIVGKPLNEININPRWGFKVVDNSGIICFQLETSGGCRLVPEDTVVAAFFKKMKAQAENFLDDEISEIYISTDFQVTEAQRNVFKKAVGKVNLEIKRFNFFDTQ